MPFSSNQYDWQVPTGFGQDITSPSAEDSFSSLKSYLEKQATIDPPSLAHLNGSSPEESTGSSPDRVAENIAKDSNQAPNKRKTNAEPTKKAQAALKDRRGNHDDAGHHSHGIDGEPANTAKPKKGRVSGGSTSEKRKEQNRNAQRAFRERRERYAKELEDKLAAMTELADQRQTENNNLKELVAQLQRETAKPSSGAVTEPIPALANSTFTFNMPSANSSSGHESPVNPSVDASSSSTPGSSSNVPTPEGATDFNALFARPSASKPPFASTPQFASGDESTTFTSYVDPILGGLGGSSLFTSTGMSPGPPLNSMASRQSATSPESLTDKHKSTGFTPFTNPSPPLSETFGRDEYSSYPSLEEILGGASSSAFEGGLIPFSDKSPAATFDAPTPASDLFAAYRDSASSFGDTLFGKVTSPPPALSNDGPLVDYNQESLSSATSTRSSSIFDSRRGDSSSLSPPSTYNDKASPASLSQDPPCEIREQFKTLRGADAFDIDSLCSDLSKKAHCKESMRVALDQAVQQDMDVYTLFNNTGVDKGTRDSYLR